MINISGNITKTSQLSKGRQSFVVNNFCQKHYFVGPETEGEFYFFIYFQTV